MSAIWVVLKALLQHSCYLGCLSSLCIFVFFLPNQTTTVKDIIFVRLAPITTGHIFLFLLVFAYFKKLDYLKSSCLELSSSSHLSYSFDYNSIPTNRAFVPERLTKKDLCQLLEKLRFLISVSLKEKFCKGEDFLQSGSRDFIIRNNFSIFNE